jgi:hypothetical protein
VWAEWLGSSSNPLARGDKHFSASPFRKGAKMRDAWGETLSLCGDLKGSGGGILAKPLAGESRYTEKQQHSLKTPPICFAVVLGFGALSTASCDRFRLECFGG